MDTMSSPREVLARAIKEQRQKNQWTQAELATLLHVNSASTIGNWESGIASPDYDKLCLMADLFGVSVDELLGRAVGDNPSMDSGDAADRKMFEQLWEWFVDLDDAGQRTVYNCVQFQHQLIDEAGPKAPRKKAKKENRAIFLVEGRDQEYDQMASKLPYLISLRKSAKKSYVEITKYLWDIGYGDEICLLFVREIFGRGLNPKVPCQKLYEEIEAFLKDKYVVLPNVERV